MLGCWACTWFHSKRKWNFTHFLCASPCLMLWFLPCCMSEIWPLFHSIRITVTVSGPSFINFSYSGNVLWPSVIRPLVTFFLDSIYSCHQLIPIKLLTHCSPLLFLVNVPCLWEWVYKCPVYIGGFMANYHLVKLTSLGGDLHSYKNISIGIPQSVVSYVPILPQRQWMKQLQTACFHQVKLQTDITHNLIQNNHCRLIFLYVFFCLFSSILFPRLKLCCIYHYFGAE